MSIKISLAGDLGSGKSTVSAILVERLGATYYSTGAICREVAASHGMSVVEMNVYMETHPELDHEIDDGVRALSHREENLIIDSRMAFLFVEAKAFYKWLFQELVGTYAFATAFNEGTVAHIPLVEIYRSKLTHLAKTHGIEIARYGLAPRCAPLSVGFFYKTDATAVFIARSKDTVLAVYNGSYKVAVAVGIHNALLVGNGARFGRHL